MARSEYIPIDDKGLINLIENHMTRKLKRVYEIKKPIIGRDRGKYLVPRRYYANLIDLLLELRRMGGENVEGLKAEWLDNPQ
jgi:hypothetical protein